MRAVTALAAVALLAAAAVSAPVPKEVKKKRPDAEVFVGEWEVAELNGPPKHVWTFDPDLTMWSKGVGSSGKGTEWKIKIDPDQSPKHIDIGPDYKGIYEIDGDEIRILYTSGTRPNGFDEKARRTYTVIRRVEKK